MKNKKSEKQEAKKRARKSKNSEKQEVRKTRS